MTRAVLLTVLALTALRVPVGLALEAMLPDTPCVAAASMSKVMQATAPAST